MFSLRPTPRASRPPALPAGYVSDCVRDHALEYACGSCGVRVPAVVRVRLDGAAAPARIWPFGGTDAEVRRAADHAARCEAELALRCAACPQCGQVPSETIRAHEDAARSERRRRAELVPLSLVVALGTGVAFGVPGVLDARRSSALLLLAFAAMAFAGAVTAAVLAWPRQRPRFIEEGVTFAPLARPSSDAWRPALTAPRWRPTPRPAGASGAHVAATTLALGAAAAVLLAASSFANTFASVYVLDAKRDGGEIRIRIDGREAGRLVSGPAGGGRDVTFTRVRLRNTAPHRLELTDGQGGNIGAFDLARGGPGWVIAPAAAEHDLCVAEEERSYALRSRAAGGAESMTVTSGDLTALSRFSYDHVFQDAPGAVARRWSLRAVSCRELAAGRTTPFAVVSPPSPAQPKTASL